MRARAAHVGDEVVEIEIAGTRDDLDKLAALLRRGRGSLTCEANHSPAPYDAFFAKIAAKSDGEERARIRADGGTVQMHGDRDSLLDLADVVEELADGPVGGHRHIEWYPNHQILAKGSVPAVFLRLAD